MLETYQNIALGIIAKKKATPRRKPSFICCTLYSPGVKPGKSLK